MENLIKKPHRSDGRTIECNGVVLRIPAGYKAYTTEGIQREIIDNKGNLIGIDTISYRCVLINAILESYDTDNEKLELVFCDEGKKIIVEKSDLYSKSKIIKLANKGMQVNSNNAKYWIEYLSKMEALNYNIIPRKRTINRLGWINSNTFIPYKNNEFEIDVDESTSSWINALKTEGSLLEWVKQMSILRKNDIFRTILATSFSAPLLKITGTRSFVIYNWAMSKRRKNSNSILCNVCMGVSRKFKSFI